MLAQSGRRVALLEKTARAGGKTQTTERKGYHFEMFGAVGIPALNSRFHELVETLGIAARVPFVVPEGNAAAVRYKAPDGTWRTMRTPLIASGSPAEMENLKRVYGVGDAELVGVPQIVIVGRGAADGEVELWDRRSGEREVVPASEVVERLRAR